MFEKFHDILKFSRDTQKFPSKLFSLDQNGLFVFHNAQEKNLPPFFFSCQNLGESDNRFFSTYFR